MPKEFIIAKATTIALTLGALLAPQIAFSSTVMIHNSLSKDEEGNVIEVDSITTDEGVKARYRLRIFPGETKELSASDLLGFQVSRIFESHRLRYEVTCEKRKSSDYVTFDIFKIHEGNVGPECKLTGYGHWSRRTGLKWLMKKKSILDKLKTRR